MRRAALSRPRHNKSDNARKTSDHVSTLGRWGRRLIANAIPSFRRVQRMHHLTGVIFVNFECHECLR